MKDLAITECSNDDMRDFTNILVHAFGDVFDSIFKGIEREDYIDIITETFSRMKEREDVHGFYIAKHDDNVIGILNVRQRGSYKHQYRILWDVLRERFGIWKSLKHVLLYKIIDEKIKDDSLHIGAIGVKENARSSGFGTRMLDFVEHLALERDIDTIKLEVISNNKRAKKLYERTGYTVERKIDSYITRMLFDVPGYYQMSKQVHEHQHSYM